MYIDIYIYICICVYICVYIYTYTCIYKSDMSLYTRPMYTRTNSKETNKDPYVRVTQTRTYV